MLAKENEVDRNQKIIISATIIKDLEPPPSNIFNTFGADFENFTIAIISLF